MGSRHAVTTPSLAPLRLQLRLAIRRVGIGNALAAVVFVAGATMWLGVLPHYQVELEAQLSKVLRLRQALQAAKQRPLEGQRPIAETRLTSFYTALGPQGSQEQQLRTIFEIAHRTGLHLNQGEYQQALNQNGNFETYQVQLPVNGGYPAVRQFTEQVLQAIPFASLDDISVKREAVIAQTPEARLRFTLYLASASRRETSALHEHDLDDRLR